MGRVPNALSRGSEEEPEGESDEEEGKEDDDEGEAEGEEEEEGIEEVGEDEWHGEDARGLLSAAGENASLGSDLLLKLLDIIVGGEKRWEGMNEASRFRGRRRKMKTMMANCVVLGRRDGELLRVRSS